MIEDKEMLQPGAANPHVFKMNRGTVFPQLERLMKPHLFTASVSQSVSR